MKLGSAAHCLILEGENEYEKRYFVLPDKLDMRRKADKETYARWRKINPNKTFVKKDMNKTIYEMRDTLKMNSKAVDLLDFSEVEMPLYWKEVGVSCKGLVDCYNHSSRIGFDLKTTDNLNNFHSKAKSFYYDVQASHYISGLEANSYFVETYFLVALETKPPYNMEIFELDADQIAISNSLRLKWLKKYEYYSNMDYYPPAQKMSKLRINREFIDEGG